jgi:hypothetical protein
MDEGLLSAQTVTVRTAPELIGEIPRNNYKAEHG